MEIYNCTVSGNVITEQWSPTMHGSGINDESGPSLYLDHCTVVSNSGPVQIWTVNTIISDSSILSNCVGTLDSFAGHNLIVATNGCTLTNNTAGNLYNVNPQLGPLRNNGGPTWTHALVMGSPAINAADPADPTPTDQRGVSRPQGPASDIGAYEFAYTPPRLVRLMPSGTNSWLQLNGSPGSPCTVQASTNCVSWVNLTNLCVGADGTLDVIDNDAADYAFRFYRLMMPVPPDSP